MDRSSHWQLPDERKLLRDQQWFRLSRKFDYGKYTGHDQRLPLDGNDLRLTHFCGAQNQPRLKAKRIDLDHKAFDFDFVDITNLKSPDAPHVHGLEIRLLDPNHITVTFLFRAASAESRELLDLNRVQTKPVSNT